MKATLFALGGEIRKGLLIGWTYRLNQLVSLLTLGFIFFVIVFFMGGGTLEADRIASALIGYLVWMYVASALSDLTYGLRAEISAGTLEQLAMSPAPVGLLLFGRVLTTQIITTLQVLVMGLIVLSVLHVQILWRIESLPALFITFLGILGFGYLVAGATILFKQMESFTNLLSNVLALLNGAFLPIGAMPAWLASISMTLPSTLGIIVVRAIMLEGRSLADTWQDGSLPALMVNSAGYLLVGLGVFTLCERMAKDQGSLGQY